MSLLPKLGRALNPVIADVWLQTPVRLNYFFSFFPNQISLSITALLRATHPHLLCFKCAVHIFISLYSQLLIRLCRFFRITPLYLRKRSKTELYHLFRSQSRKRFRGSSAREGITRKPNFVPTLPAFVLNLGRHLGLNKF